MPSLREAFADRDGTLMLLNVHPLFDGLRSDPRFIELVRQVGPVPRRGAGAWSAPADSSALRRNEIGPAT
jgi:hypothetical protein